MTITLPYIGAIDVVAISMPLASTRPFMVAIVYLGLFSSLVRLYTRFIGVGGGFIGVISDAAEDGGVPFK